MNPLTVMLIAGEPSGDQIAAELVEALRRDPQVGTMAFAPRFIGAGGPRMAAAGVALDFDLTRHAVVGLSDVLKRIGELGRLLRRLVDLACEHRPGIIVCVDFGGFNLRFIRALRRRLARERGVFHNWRPRVVQYVSPQVWASRPGRATLMAANLDLLLCILPFEKAWYARHAPHLRVEFVGHPLLDRHAVGGPNHDTIVSDLGPSPGPESPEGEAPAAAPRIVLLPGSRAGELKRHLPVMLDAASLIDAGWKAAQGGVGSPGAPAASPHHQLVLPDERTAALAREILARHSHHHAGFLRRRRIRATRPAATTAAIPEVQVGNLGEALSHATLAIACTGTVTLECALYGVPTVALYKTSALTYQAAKRIVTVKHLSMPNLLADGPVFPEFIQGAASADNLAKAALELLRDQARRVAIRAKLAKVTSRLGGPGASRRAAALVASLM